MRDRVKQDDEPPLPFAPRDVVKVAPLRYPGVEGHEGRVRKKAPNNVLARVPTVSLWTNQSCGLPRSSVHLLHDILCSMKGLARAPNGRKTEVNEAYETVWRVHEDRIAILRQLAR